MNNYTDKELLTLAAKAAGITVLDHEYEDCSGFTYRIGEYQEPIDSFNPLHDDGDALRLAVKLRINLHIDEQKENLNSAFFSRYVYAIANGADEGAADLANSDPYAATRRAIVRAAAEIWRKL